MEIYIDESGSINNHSRVNPYFVISMVRVLDSKKLKTVVKRFVSSNYDRLKELDKPKINPKTGKIDNPGGRMFQGNKFKELKGAQFDRDMREKFLSFFSRKPLFEVYYIVLDNKRLTDIFCKNTARAFNYSLKLALGYFVSKGILPDEECNLHLDERNESTRTRYFLGDYLNTELVLGQVATGPFSVRYYDSCNNKLVQVADVFANVYYSELLTHHYSSTIRDLKNKGIIKYVFRFPK